MCKYHLCRQQHKIERKFEKRKDHFFDPINAKSLTKSMEGRQKGKKKEPHRLLCYNLEYDKQKRKQINRRFFPQFFRKNSFQN